MVSEPTHTRCFKLLTQTLHECFICRLLFKQHPLVPLLKLSTIILVLGDLVWIDGKPSAECSIERASPCA